MQTLQYTKETAQYAGVCVTWFPLILMGATRINLCAEIHEKLMSIEFTIPKFALWTFVPGYLHLHKGPGKEKTEQYEAIKAKAFRV